jgi:hypothetical protein
MFNAPPMPRHVRTQIITRVALFHPEIDGSITACLVRFCVSIQNDA